MELTDLLTAGLLYWAVLFAYGVALVNSKTVQKVSHKLFALAR